MQWQENDEYGDARRCAATVAPSRPGKAQFRALELGPPRYLICIVAPKMPARAGAVGNLSCGAHQFWLALCECTGVYNSLFKFYSAHQLVSCRNK